VETPAGRRATDTLSADRIGYRPTWENVIAAFWASIGAAILTAGVTTLLVEYLAKPGLEVRKDRIVEAARTQRARLDALHHCMGVAYEIVTDLCDHQQPSEDREQAIELAGDIATGLRDVWELDVPADLRDAWLRATAEMSAIARKIQRQGPNAERCEQLEAYADLAYAFEVLLRSGRIHWIRRRSVRRAIREWEDTTTTPEIA
jgi:hypothetical protein